MQSVFIRVLVIPNSKLLSPLKFHFFVSYWVKNHCPYWEMITYTLSWWAQSIEYLCYFLWDFCHCSLELILKPYIPANQSQITLNLFSWYRMAATTFSLFFYLHVFIVCLQAWKVQVHSHFNNSQPRFTFWLIIGHSFLGSSSCFLQGLCLFLATFLR